MNATMPEPSAAVSAVHGATDEFARRLFTPRGTDYLSPDVLKSCATLNLDLDPAQVCAIPFSDAELRRARELGQFLIYHHDQMKTGPFSMKLVNAGCDNRLGEGKLFYDTDWYREQPFYGEADVPGWYLVGTEVIPGSVDLNYLDQTGVIVDYLVNQVYAGQDLPPSYADAVEEYKSHKKAIEKLVRDNWQEGAKQATELKINQWFRESAAQAFYNNTAYFEVNGKYLLKGMWAWTKTRSSDGYIVDVGSADEDGLGVNYDYPGSLYSDLGVRFSRSVVPVMKF